jgi:hypothetical protein
MSINKIYQSSKKNQTLLTNSNSYYGRYWINFLNKKPLSSFIMWIYFQIIDEKFNRIIELIYYEIDCVNKLVFDS